MLRLALCCPAPMMMMCSDTEDNGTWGARSGRGHAQARPVRLKPLVVSLLLVGASGCAWRQSGAPTILAQSATLAMHHGDLAEAQTLADRGIALTRTSPQAPSAWRFKLLSSEVLVRKHALPDARRLLAEPVPTGAEFDALRARHGFVQGYAEFLDGQPDAALVTLERAATAAPEEDAVRLDIGCTPASGPLSARAKSGRRDQTAPSARHGDADQRSISPGRGAAEPRFRTAPREAVRRRANLV